MIEQNTSGALLLKIFVSLFADSFGSPKRNKIGERRKNPYTDKAITAASGFVQGERKGQQRGHVIMAIQMDHSLLPVREH